jgi:putative CocE/NonD family hydrolase
MRDRTALMAVVHRPDSDVRVPALIAASPYPRQIQDLGAPMGFVEAGATDFWVPRGYAHVIANLRGTGGSGGTFGFFDAQERRDMHDLVEWVAAQPWCDSNVGMMGISYFAMTQLQAAVERPPHLKAIFPVAVTADLYEGAVHNGLFSSSFITPFLAMVGLTAGRSDKFWRSPPLRLARDVRLHSKFATMNGESALTVLRQLLKLPHDPHPWDDLWLDIAVKHPTRDEWWDERNLLPLLKNINIPMYLGCDWQNAPLHLRRPSPRGKRCRAADVSAWDARRVRPDLAVGKPARRGAGVVRPLAQGRDTGIVEGPALRYFLPGADDWHTADSWPPPCSHREFALRADGALAEEEGESGDREYLVLGAGNQARSIRRRC